MRLADLAVNQQGTITDIRDVSAAQRLFDYGILPGNVVLVVAKAPFRGPMYIMVEGNRVAIRRREAKLIEVNQ